jgi:ABC-type spermidine/putrescine transport system permease subunit II
VDAALASRLPRLGEHHWTKAQVGPLVGLSVLLLLIPLGLLVTYAFRSSSIVGVGPGPTLVQFQDVFQSSATLKLIERTALLAVSVAAIVTLLSLVFAFGATFRLKRRTAHALLAIVLVSGVVSFIVRVYAWGTILGTGGLINDGLERLGVIDEPLGFLFFGYFAVFVAMVYVYLPVGVITMYGSLQGISREELEASRDLGVGRWRTLTRVVLPQARVGLAATFVLTALLASADFVTPTIVGGTRGQTIGLTIQETALTTGDLPNAAAIAIVFGLAVLGIVLVAALLWFATRQPRSAAADAVDRVATRLSPRAPAFLSRISFSRPATILLAIYLVVPSVVVLVFSFNSASSLGLPWRGFTLDWYSNVTERPGFGEALSGSVKIAVVAVIGSIVVGVPYAFALARSAGRTKTFLLILAVLPWVIPGVLLGVALLTIADAGRLTLGLGPTAAAHVLIIVPVMIMAIYARLTAMDPRLIEAANDLGSSPGRAFRTITVPLLLPSLIGAALLGAAFSFDEIMVTTFTIGLNDTLPIWLLGQARLGFDAGINALGIMLMLGTLLIFAAAAVLMRGVSSLLPNR